LKALLVYFVALLMFSTSSLYILVSIYGESIESSKAHGLQLVEGQEEETTESGHNEEQEGAETFPHRPALECGGFLLLYLG
jgi:hypothetical protein